MTCWMHDLLHLSPEMINCRIKPNLARGSSPMPTRPLKYRTARLAPRLTVQTGPRQGEVFIIRKSTTLIGRSETCDITIAEQLVSRRHCHIIWDGAYCTLEDLGSTNGTFVNEHRLIEPHVLRPGDVIRVAGISLSFLDPQATLILPKWPQLVIERTAKRVTVDGKPVELSAKEYALLIYLHDSNGRVCSKGAIAKAVWPDYKGDVFDYQIESLVKRLRQKLEPNAEESHFVATIYGKGYRLMKP